MPLRRLSFGRLPSPPAAPADDAREDHEVKSFLEHLEDLRHTLLRMAAAFAVALGVALPFAPRIFAWLRLPLARALGDPAPYLRSLEVGGAFALALKLGFWSALILSAPLLIYFAARFVFPGLTRRERRVVSRALGAAAGLFAFGVALGYYITLPLALKVMLAIHDWMGVRAEWIIASYVVFALQLLLAFGLVFELPIVIVALGRMGIVTADGLRRYRRHAIVVLLIVAAILTPPDVVTQLAMGVPLILLYEACIWVVAWGERRQER